jgi:hypothetical protein
MIMALVSLLVLVAVPLYLWRRPHPLPPASASAPASAAAGAGSSDAPASSAAVLAGDAGALGTDAGDPTMALARRVTLESARTVRCLEAGAGKILPERCDRLPFFEDALTRAIRDNVACAPPTPTGGTVSFVLTVDFRHKKNHLWAGRSGSIKKRTAGDLLRCVAHALPTPDWPSLQHQYGRYDIGVMASYPASGFPSGAAGPGTPGAAPVPGGLPAMQTARTGAPAAQAPTAPVFAPIPPRH